MAGPRANLVIRPEKLGDMIVATPVLRAFKASFPDQPLHLLTDRVSAELVRHDPCIDRIITVDWRGRNGGQHMRWLDIYRMMRSYQYERAAILYSNLAGWNWLCAGLGIRKVAQLGGTWPAVLLGHKMVLRRMFSQPKHFAEYYLDVARTLGCEVSSAQPRLLVGNEERQALARRFPAYCEARPRIMIHPFFLTASANYSLAAYQRLGLRLSAIHGGPVYIVGTKDEQARWAPYQGPGLDTSLMGALSIRELMAALSMADVVIGGSSGIAHMAADLDVAVVALYCSDHHHDIVWKPYGPKTVCLVPGAGLCAHAPSCSLRMPRGGGCDLSFGIPEDSVVKAVADSLMMR